MGLQARIYRSPHDDYMDVQGTVSKSARKCGHRNLVLDIHRTSVTVRYRLIYIILEIAQQTKTLQHTNNFFYLDRFNRKSRATWHVFRPYIRALLGHNLSRS
jgi:hypothetical protein